MKKYQARKAISVLLTLLMLMSSVYLGLGVIASAADPEEVADMTATALEAGKVYTVTRDTIIQGSSSSNGMTVAEGVTVIIDIAEGVTLTVKGGNASGQNAGKAGILLGSNSKLIFTGKGNLALIGGNGANGAKGVNANGSTGGAGGVGGGGGGAAIGGDGANGGAVATKGGSVSWPSNASVTMEASINDSATAGSNATNSGVTGGSAGSGNQGGGGGGAGGAGYGAPAIGSGGPGGGGGSAGANGGKTSGCSGKEYKGKGGNGGKGAANGANGTGSTDSNSGTPAAGGATGSGRTEKTAAAVFPFQALRDAIANNVAYYSMTMAQMLQVDSDTLQDALDELSDAYDTMIAAYNTDIYIYYFSGYDTVTTIETLTSAIAIAENITLAQWLQAMAGTDVDYDAEYSTLNAVWNTFNTKYTTYAALPAATRTFIEDAGYIVPSQVEAKLAEYQYAKDIANIRENYYDLITGDVATFSAYDTDWVAETDSAGSKITAAVGAISSYVTTLNGLNQDAVTYVFGEGYVANTLNPLLEQLGALVPYNTYKEGYLQYRTVYLNAIEPVNLEGSNDYLYNVLNSYDSWYTNLKTTIDELYDFDEDFAEKVFNGLDAVMVSKIDSIYTALNARLAAQIDTAYDYYQGFVEQYGYTINTSDDISVSNYRALRQVFNNLNSTQYEFLVNSNNFTVPAETVAKYDAIKKALFAFENYDPSMGLSAYAFNNDKVVDIVRDVTEYDKVRNLEYVVDAEKRETIYNNVKALLGSDLLKNLLGGDAEGEEEEGGFSLDAIADGLEEKIFSNSLVNMLVSFVYPFVVQYFAQTWAGIPKQQTVEAQGYEVPLTLNIISMRQALNLLGLPMLPNQLAATGYLNNYPEIKSMLAAITYDAVYDQTTETLTKNPWADESLPKDDSGNLDFDWRVHDKASFIDAMDAALSGAWPLLKALLCNQQFHKDTVKVGTGSGSTTAAGCVTVNVTVDPINLTMEFSANAGFNNMLAPILSALGATNLANGNACQNARQLATALANPLEQIINQLKADPLDFILKTLPNLAFALDYDLINPVMQQMTTGIKYWADAHYETDCSQAGPGDVEDALNSKNDVIEVNVGELLLGGLNLDFNSAPGLVNSIVGLLNKSDEEAEGEEPAEPTGIAALLPMIVTDELFEKLAYWGDDVVWNKGYRTVSPYSVSGMEGDMPYIVATPSEVFAHLVTYLLETLDDDTLAALLGALGLEIDLDDEENIIVSILNKILNDPEMAIAAIAELMIPQAYDNWAELEEPADTFTYNDAEVTPADIAYLKYANDWDKPTATTIANNVDELIPTIAGLLGSDISLNETLQGLLNGLFTNANITKVNNLLAGLAAPADEGEGEEEAGGIDLLGILKDVAGIDLSGIEEVPEDYNWGFEDGDKAGFVNVLCGLLDPLAPLLKLMLPGKDISVLDGIVNVKGYDVYPHTFALLFDALGIDQVTGYADMTASEELEAILNALLDWVDDLTAEGNSMIKDLLEALPDLIYFIESNGLSVLIKNLLYPVQIVIDTVYPLYEIDILALITKLGGSDEEEPIADDEEEGLDLMALLSDLDFNNLKMDSILAIVDARLGTTLLSSPLGTYAVPALTIKNGNLDAADVLTILLCGVIEAFETESVTAGVTNGEVIIGMIDKDEKILPIYKKIVPLVTGGEAGEIDPDKITPINWAYMYGEDFTIPLDTGFDMPEYSNEAVINYLSTYEKNQWTAELAEYLNDNLDTIVADVLQVAGQDPDMLTTLLSGLINDKLYTADVVNAAGEAIYGLLADLEDQLKVVIDAMLGTEIAGKTYTPVASVNGKADFIAKMKDILNPFNRILGFVLFGQSYKFFNGTTRDDLITISGGDAYDAALVPVLEALGVTMPKKDTFTSTGDAIDKVLTAVTDRLDAICADPINEILDLLPNVLYFLNADGLKAIINNAVLPFDALVEAATGDPIATLLEGVEVGGVALNDLNTTALLTLIEGLADITIPDAIKTAISSFYIGKAVKAESANDLLAFKLAYDGDRKDMITILASVLIEVLAYEDNAKILKGISEEAYQTVLNILGKSDEEISVPMKVPEWLYPEAADTDQTFSGMNTSVEFGAYGPLFTQEMALYIAAHLDSFIDNMIYLLGIPADSLESLGIHSSTDEYITSLKDLLSTVIGDTIYTPAIANMILNVVEEKLVKTVNTLTINGVDMSDIVKNVLKKALGVDLDRYTNGEEFINNGDGTYSVQPFADGSKDGFLNALVQILDPLYPVLNWLLCEEDIHFFTDSNGDHEITLKGGQGYKYGIIPLLETFDCSDLPSQADVSATTDTASLVNTIATPLLNRIDKVLENPVDEIFEMLPNVAYFINSKGLDACVRNMTNAINVVLKALQPLIGDVDLFAALGIDLSTIDMQYLMNVITDKLSEGSTQDLVPLVVDALAEMTTGKIVTFNSASELEPYYKMEYAGETSKADTITILLRFALRWVALNKDQLKTLVREKIEMSDEGYAYIDKMIDIVGTYAGTNTGMDSILHMFYYIFYGVDTGTTKVANWQRDYNTRLELVAEGQAKASKTDENLGNVAELLDWLFTEYVDEDADTGNVYHNYDDEKPKGFAPNGFIAFFQQIIQWFKTIFNKLFGR